MKKIVLLLVLILCVSSVAFASESQQSRSKRKKATTTRVEKTPKTKSMSTAAPAWLEGNWKYTTTMMGQRFECRVGISGNTIVVMYNGDMMYSGPFVIKGDELIYDQKNGSSSYLLLDRANQQLMADRSTPFYRF